MADLPKQPFERGETPNQDWLDQETRGLEVPVPPPPAEVQNNLPLTEDKQDGNSDQLRSQISSLDSAPPKTSALLGIEPIRISEEVERQIIKSGSGNVLADASAVEESLQSLGPEYWTKDENP